jgi:hypothetical protein
MDGARRSLQTIPRLLKGSSSPGCVRASGTSSAQGADPEDGPDQSRAIPVAFFNRDERVGRLIASGFRHRERNVRTGERKQFSGLAYGRTELNAVAKRSSIGRVKRCLNWSDREPARSGDAGEEHPRAIQRTAGRRSVKPGRNALKVGMIARGCAPWLREVHGQRLGQPEAGASAHAGSGEQPRGRRSVCGKRVASDPADKGERHTIASRRSRALTARGIKTARDGEWSAVQVADILRRV